MEDILLDEMFRIMIKTRLTMTNPGRRQGMVCNVLWLLGLWVLISKVPRCQCHNRTEEERVLDHLFVNYNPSARPVLNSSKTVNVKLRFSLLQIQELNVRSQILKTTGILILDWTDERLTWDPELTGLNELIIGSHKLWRPEFAVINGAEGIYGDYGHFQANIYPNGSIRWEPGGMFKTMCQIDITYYPFDEQQCDLVFGAWSYYTTKMNLTTDRHDISLESYETNGEWRITKTSLQRREFAFDCCPDQRFSNIAFTIHLQRRSTFYIMNVILPGILTSAVLLSIFFCTPSQKIHIGVAALLSFRLFLLNVADTIPRTSDHVPLLGIYLTCTMAITTMAMVATVFVLNLYGMKEKPVPLWAKKLFVVYLARILCMCTPRYHSYTSHDSNQQYPGSQDQQQHSSRPPATEGRTDIWSDQAPARRQDGQYSSARGHPASTNVSDDKGQSSSRAPPYCPPGGSTSGVRNTEQQHEGHVSRKYRPNYGRDWVHVAAVCDRFFFWLCLLFITATTLLLFHPLTTSRIFPF